ncbi:aldo/keto reductase [Marinomonas epiphytica]
MNVGLGTASFGTSIPESQAHAILDAYVALGGKIIDTANNYAFWAGKGGESEAVIGTWLNRQVRERLEIHTKIGAQPTDGINFETAEGLSAAAIHKAIEASLKRLSTNYLDVLYAHIDDQKTPLYETWSTLSEYVNQGVVKKLGISNFSVSRVKELLTLIEENNLAPLDYAQYRHSVIAPNAQADFGVQVCLSEELAETLLKFNPDIQLVAFSPLLDGAFELNQELPSSYDSKLNRQTVLELQYEALTHGVSPSALVLKKISESGVLPLTMTSKIERLHSNLACFR